MNDCLDVYRFFFITKNVRMPMNWDDIYRKDLYNVEGGKMIG